VNTELVDGTHRLLCDCRPVGRKLVVLTGGRPPARTASVATRHALLARRSADEAAQLAYSEWLLTKLAA
jgi:hypothetical protein